MISKRIGTRQRKFQPRQQFSKSPYLKKRQLYLKKPSYHHKPSSRKKHSLLQNPSVRKKPRFPKKLPAYNKPILNTAFMQNARDAGEKDASIHNIEAAANPIKALNHLYNLWTAQWGKPISKEIYAMAAQSYQTGFFTPTRKSSPNWILLPSMKSISAIITVMNEENTIISVIAQLQRLPIDEIIVVINGSVDNSLHQARVCSKAMIIHYPQALGHDVGRSIGAKLAKSDILLFLDGDFPIQGEHLVPFIEAVAQGLDIALNDVSSLLPVFSLRDRVSVMKEFVNHSMERPDLNANSLTAVPHALSRKCLETIGYDSLMVPPKAQAKAVRLGLQVGAPMSVNVISNNKVRSGNSGEQNVVANMIIGDHVEALEAGMQVYGKRLFFQDEIRNRDLAGVMVP